MKPLHALFGLGLTFGAIASSGEAQAQGTAYGCWLTDDAKGIVQVAPCGREVCGTLVKIRDPAAPSHDINNPDPDLRSRPLIGIRILSGFEPSGTMWKNGIAYDPKVGRNYRASFRLNGNDRLDVTGCVLFLCRTRHWTRLIAENGK